MKIRVLEKVDFSEQLAKIFNTILKLKVDRD